ncbi:MAG: hypothetical protein LBQ35_08865 [Spirochaetaceae bacterium]|jgi:hypothetical protein|nr:hypothetical protein [Spirochaetaceae bacterium]
MKKRFLLTAAFSVILTAATGLGAQTARHTITAGTSGVAGLAAGYEFRLNNSFSVGGELGWSLIFPTFLFIEATGVWRPWEGIFGVTAGAGYGSLTSLLGAYLVDGFLLHPGVEWKIDFGNPNGFLFRPSLSLPLVFGVKDDWNWLTLKNEKVFGVGMGLLVRLEAGFAF